MSFEKQSTDLKSAELPTDRQIKKPLARRIVLTVVFIAFSVGVIFNIGTGTISSFGWDYIASVCPLGVLETMVAAKTLIPRGLVFFLFIVIFLAFFGKVFCSWICFVPSFRNLFDAVTHRKPTLKSVSSKNGDGGEGVTLRMVKPLSRRERKALQAAQSSREDGLAQDDCQTQESGQARETCQAQESAGVAGQKESCNKACGACGGNARARLDSRHLILGGSLLSAAIFGFPVFCLICPIGLTFASVIAIVQLFGSETLSWSLLVFPLILILELTVLRKWCLKFCPLGALASLLSLPNRFFRPKVDESKCLRNRGVDCQICTSLCPEELDPHEKTALHECSKCRDCAVNCPTGAISFPFFKPKNNWTNNPRLPFDEITL